MQAVKFVVLPHMMVSVKVLLTLMVSKAAIFISGEGCPVC